MSAAYNSFDSFGDDDEFDETANQSAITTPAAEPLKCVALYTYEVRG